jgi:hypothetical protein
MCLFLCLINRLCGVESFLRRWQSLSWSRNSVYRIRPVRAVILHFFQNYSSINILFRLRTSLWDLSLRFSNRNLYYFPAPPCLLHVPPGLSCSIWRRVQIKKLQPPAHAGSSLAYFSTLKMEALCSSEVSAHTRSTRRHIPEDGILHSHRRENFKCYMMEILFLCWERITPHFGRRNNIRLRDATCDVHYLEQFMNWTQI